MLPNVGHQIVHVKIAGITRNRHILYVSRLRVNKPNMKLQGTDKLLCGMFCDVNALEATLSMLRHHANEQNHDDFSILKKKKTVYESYKLPSEWQRLKDNFVGVIQRV